MITQSYSWNNYRCAYEVHTPSNQSPEGTPLMLIHPIGVGLSRQFWQPFCEEWYKIGQRNQIYNPDLLGCGETDMPHVAITPTDWAQQLQKLLQIVQRPVILVVQGALFPVAIELVKRQSDMIAGLVLSGPPAWALITKKTPQWRQKLQWNLLFDSPVGNLFYRYARREKFLHGFSVKQLFASENDVDRQWLDMLHQGSENMASRYAVYSFLAGFWRQDYGSDIEAISQPTMVLFGETASSISETGKTETPQQRLKEYTTHLPQGQGTIIPGRNVLPYESTAEFVKVIAPFINKI